MEQLKLKLIRVALREDYTEGVLFNENTNEKLFDILEDRVRDANGNGVFDGEEKKIYGETAIPYGEYDLEVTYSPKFKMDMVLVKDVPNFTGIRLHWGRTAKQSLGCILGGLKTGKGELANIGYTKAMVDLLNKYGGKAKLLIV